MAKGQFVNLNCKDIAFSIAYLSNNKYALVITENSIRNVFDIFKDKNDAVSAYLDIINDYIYGMNELYCRRSRWQKND